MWPGPSELDLSNNKFEGPFLNWAPYNDITYRPWLTFLDLSYNYFKAGPFPSWVSNLSSLEILALEDNNFTGTLNLTKVSTSTSKYQVTLRSISIMNNGISEVFYNGLICNLQYNFKTQREHNLKLACASRNLFWGGPWLALLTCVMSTQNNSPRYKSKQYFIGRKSEQR